MNLQVPYHARNFLTSWKSVSFSRRILFRGVAIVCSLGSRSSYRHAQKPDFVFRRNGRVHLNRQGPQFIRLLAHEVWASAVVILDTLCFEVVWTVLTTHSIRQFPLHFPSRASPCAITFHLESTCSGARMDFPPNVSFPHCQISFPYDAVFTRLLSGYGD